MQIVITIEKWASVSTTIPGTVKTSGTITISGNADLVQELIELVKAAGYTII